MKNILRYFPLLSAALLMVSCFPDQEEGSPKEKENYVTVGFKTGGEISFSNSPLKQSETADLFAIQFYEAETGEPYAHVLGEDIGQVQVDFKKDQAYKLKMAYLKNGKNIIIEDSQDRWGIPFTTEYTATQLHQTYYSSATQFLHISSAYITAIDESVSGGRYVEVDRYHSVSESFLVTQDTEQINIHLKRMVFGITLNVELLDPTVENLRFSVNSTENHQQVYSIPLSDGKGSLTIPFLTLGFPDLYVEGPLDYGVTEGYTENVHISLGTEENPLQFYNNKVPISRNAMAIMTFLQDGTQEGSEGNITFNLEEGELEEVVVNLPTTN